ncbi:MAG: 4Fe-4S dicluster domain-containing protein [Chloroflexi bacterium]|nr:4Fe-4S dicluster domain-containing protein [Chloroflexota bacterium]
MRSDWVISTNRARCRDCYRCVRGCPVKAVRVREGQAQIVPELCIACAHCVRVCPQGAKVIRDDREAVRQAIANGLKVVATVAPSAPAFFAIDTFDQLADALQALGFIAVEETAFGAEMVGKAHRELVDAEPERWPIITSSCPVVVNLIERYYPDLIPHLAPIVSPMIAHGRWLQQHYGSNTYVVFIGPCIAKKAEILREPVLGAVQAAITYAELQEWLDAEGIRIVPTQRAVEVVPRVNARIFPVEGGLVGTANMDTDILTSHIVTTSGLEACEDVLRGVRSGSLAACMVELMACEGGCINGPVMEDQVSAFLARQRVIQFAARRQPRPLPTREQWPDLSCHYADRSVVTPEFGEAQILEVLHAVDKFSPEDELNCGACGYSSCREKAIATLRGMAEPTMCIPYMRRRAESLRQVVMDVTPDAVLIVDTRLYIQEMSPSAEKMFGTRLSQVVGRPLQSILPATDGFARVRNTGQPLLNETVTIRPELVVEQTIVPVKGQSLLVGILRDVTDEQRHRRELEHIRRETLARTEQVVNNQMRVAQEIAQLLGETTAEAKVALSRLARLLQEDRGE